jgi:hypothetical protein
LGLALAIQGTVMHVVSGKQASSGRPIARRADLEAREFYSLFHRQKPVIVTGQLSEWAAYNTSIGGNDRHWASTLAKRLANVPVKNHCLHPEEDLVEKPLSAFTERDGCHVFQNILHPNPSSLAIHQEVAGDFGTPLFFQGLSNRGDGTPEGAKTFARQQLDEEEQRLMPLAGSYNVQVLHFGIGSAQSGTFFHAHGDVAHCLVLGRKRWLIYSPGDWERMWEAMPKRARELMWSQDTHGYQVRRRDQRS